jgi:hypothetical protein
MGCDPRPRPEEPKNLKKKGSDGPQGGGRIYEPTLPHAYSTAKSPLID